MFLHNFNKIRCFELKHPKKLIQDCFWEESENKYKRVYEQVYEELSYVKKEKMKQYIWNNLDDKTKLIKEIIQIKVNFQIISNSIER